MNTDWEKEFDKFRKKYGLGGLAYISLKPFIRTQLTRQRLLDIAWLEEEGMKLWVFGESDNVGGPYSDVPMRGPSVEHCTFIKREDILTLLASRKAEIEKEAV